MPRKGAVITKKFIENGNSVNAYVVFKTEESAQQSLAHNMALVGGNHIRVDAACPPRKKLKGDSSVLYDKKRTVFVGNLPFDVKDEEVYQLFSSLKNLESSIEAIRVIRDPGSSMGKGIAYVLFKTMDDANLVLKKRNLKIRDRELRLSHAKSMETSLKRKNNSSQPEATPKRPAIASYQGLRASKSDSHGMNPSRAKPRSQPSPEPKGWTKIRTSKRPAVAARKEKAQLAVNTPRGAGSKRKLADRTPQSSGKKTKKVK